MSIQLKGTDSTISVRWIPRYTALERLLHWVHTATFLPLALTGFWLFVPWLQPLVPGEAGVHLRLIHRLTAVFFGGVPIVYALFQPRRLLLHLKEFLSFGKDDLLWVKEAFPYYVLGKHEDMPPQPRFNTGERLNALVMALGTITFGITGLSMWFLKGIMPVWLFQVMVFVHDLMFVVTVAMFIIHIYLAVIHPMMWQSLISMRYGVVSESYAREHHAKWYYGEKKAIEMWEARRRAAQSERETQDA